jgi:uncharacterized membrane protein
MYSKQANTESWVAVANPEGWSEEKTAQLTAILESQPNAGD